MCVSPSEKDSRPLSSSPFFFWAPAALLAGDEPRRRRRNGGPIRARISRGNVRRISSGANVLPTFDRLVSQIHVNKLDSSVRHCVAFPHIQLQLLRTRTLSCPTFRNYELG